MAQVAASCLLQTWGPEDVELLDVSDVLPMLLNIVSPAFILFGRTNFTAFSGRTADASQRSPWSLKCVRVGLQSGMLSAKDVLDAMAVRGRARCKSSSHPPPGLLFSLLAGRVRRVQVVTRSASSPSLPVHLPASHSAVSAAVAATGSTANRGAVVSCYADWLHGLSALSRSDVDPTSKTLPVSVSDHAAFLADDIPRRPLSLWSTTRRVAWSSLCLIAVTAAVGSQVPAGSSNSEAVKAASRRILSSVLSTASSMLTELALGWVPDGQGVSDGWSYADSGCSEAMVRSWLRVLLLLRDVPAVRDELQSGAWQVCWSTLLYTSPLSVRPLVIRCLRFGFGYTHATAVGRAMRIVQGSLSHLATGETPVRAIVDLVSSESKEGEDGEARQDLRRLSSFVLDEVSAATLADGGVEGGHGGGGAVSSLGSGHTSKAVTMEYLCLLRHLQPLSQFEWTEAVLQSVMATLEPPDDSEFVKRVLERGVASKAAGAEVIVGTVAELRVLRRCCAVLWLLGGTYDVIRAGGYVLCNPASSRSGDEASTSSSLSSTLAKRALFYSLGEGSDGGSGKRQAVVLRYSRCDGVALVLFDTKGGLPVPTEVPVSTLTAVEECGYPYAHFKITRRLLRLFQALMSVQVIGAAAESMSWTWRSQVRSATLISLMRMLQDVSAIGVMDSNLLLNFSRL